MNENLLKINQEIAEYQADIEKSLVGWEPDMRSLLEEHAKALRKRYWIREELGSRQVEMETICSLLEELVKSFLADLKREAAKVDFENRKYNTRYDQIREIYDKITFAKMKVGQAMDAWDKLPKEGS